jgi:hypothetical protein
MRLQNPPSCLVLTHHELAVTARQQQLDRPPARKRQRAVWRPIQHDPAGQRPCAGLPQLLLLFLISEAPPQAAAARALRGRRASAAW